MSPSVVGTVAVIVVLVSGVALFAVALYYHLTAIVRKRRAARAGSRPSAAHDSAYSI